MMQYIVPSIDVIKRVCTEALTQGTRKLYEVLIAPLSESQRQKLDNLLSIREGTMISWLSWLRQSPGAPNAKHIMAHIERLRTIENLALPEGLERSVHPHGLFLIAREGGQMTAQHLRDLESFHRYATLVAVVLDTRVTLIDEIIDMHDRMLGMLFNRAKRHHSDRFQQSGKTINDKLRLYSRIGRVLVEAKQNGSDPFAAIESILPWEIFAESVIETEKLAQPANFDFLPLNSDGFPHLSRYTPSLLESLRMKAAPIAEDILKGVNTIKGMNQRQARKAPKDAPTSFIRIRWPVVRSWWNRSIYWSLKHKIWKRSRCYVLHPYIRSVCTLSYQGHQCCCTRCNSCIGWFTVP